MNRRQRHWELLVEEEKPEGVKEGKELLGNYYSAPPDFYTSQLDPYFTSFIIFSLVHGFIK